MRIRDFFAGSANFCVENGGFAMLNRLRKYRLTNVIISDNHLRFTAPLANKNEIKKILARETVTITENKNIFAALNFFYARLVLSIAAVVFLAAFFVLNNFIFAVTVSGVSGEQEQQIKQYISEQNIRALTLKSTRRAQEVATMLTAKFDFVAHASTKIIGNTLVFSVYSVDTPNTAEINTDMVATADGVVTSVIVASGRALVGVGDIVRKGDILIKGEYQVGENEWQPCRASGEVRAEVKYSESVIIYDTMQIMTPTGVTKTVTDIFCTQFGGKRTTQEKIFENFKVTEEISKFTLFFEFTIVKTTYHELKLKTGKVDLNTYKNTAATELLEKIIARTGIKEFDKVDNFFSTLTPQSMAVEVVTTIDCSIV